jgi:hypothetical protein
MGIGTESAMLNELRKLVKEQERTNRLLEALLQANVRSVFPPPAPWQQPEPNRD